MLTDETSKAVYYFFLRPEDVEPSSKTSSLSVSECVSVAQLPLSSRQLHVNDRKARGDVPKHPTRALVARVF